MNTPLHTNSTEVLILLIIIFFLLLIIAWFMGRTWFKRQVLTDDRCPKCGKTSFHRIHRTYLDRILGVGLPARRYRCDTPLCRWSGLRIHQHTHHHNHESGSSPA